MRQTIENSGFTMYQVAKESGVAPAILSRFMSGKRTLTLPTAEKIAQIVGLTLKKEG